MERLHKFMARCGVASRRQAENFIRAGRVTVNGNPIAELGVKVDPDADRVEVDGKIIKPETAICYLAHKPVGYAATVADDCGRKTVLDLLPPRAERIYPAGRLEIESEGLIILTNRGDITYFLTHPSNGVRKVYEATVDGEVTDATLATLLEKGIYLGAEKIKPLAVKIVRRQPDSTVVQVIVADGVNRVVRRLFAALGHEVRKLIRLEVGPFSIDGIKRGDYRPATAHEMQILRQMMENPVAKAETAKPLPRSAFAKSIRPHGKPDPATNRSQTRQKPMKITPERQSRHENRSEESIARAGNKQKIENKFGARRPARAERSNQPHSRQERSDAPRTDFRRPPARNNREQKSGERNFAPRTERTREFSSPGNRDKRNGRDRQNQQNDNPTRRPHRETSAPRRHPLKNR